MMTFLMLESGAVVLAALIAFEMRRQHRSWRFTLTCALTVLALLTLMIGLWRGG